MAAQVRREDQLRRRLEIVAVGPTQVHRNAEHVVARDIQRVLRNQRKKPISKYNCLPPLSSVLRVLKSLNRSDIRRVSEMFTDGSFGLEAGQRVGLLRGRQYAVGRYRRLRRPGRQ